MNNQSSIIDGRGAGGDAMPVIVMITFSDYSRKGTNQVLWLSILLVVS